MYILTRGGEGEYTEKRSKFLAHIAPIRTEEEAAIKINEYKKKYYDARHNCSAYIVLSDGETTIEKSNDDGEPSGTAGRPMLDILSGSELCGVVAVVTRYFGGTLLGTGGLVRAYGSAINDGLSHCEKAELTKGIRLTLNISYPDLAKVKHLMHHYDVGELSGDYADSVRLTLISPNSHFQGFSKDLIQLSGGKITPTDTTDVMYYYEDHDITLL